MELVKFLENLANLTKEVQAIRADVQKLLSAQQIHTGQTGTESRYLSIAEASRRYTLAENTLRYWIATKRLPVRKLGKRVLIEPEAIEALITKKA